MRTRLSRRRHRAATPRPVTDQAEAAHIARAVRTSALSALPQIGPKPLYDELALHAELAVDRELAGRLLYVIDEPGQIRGRRGQEAGLVHVLCETVVLPSDTHDKFTGKVISGWDQLWRPHAAFSAPQLARASLEVPGSLAELHDQLTANIVELDEPHHVLATGDVVVPALYGSDALVVHVPAGVAVRALAGCAGHNMFVATQRIPVAQLAA